MRIKMKQAAHHRVNGGKSISYKADESYSVPKDIADALIGRDVASPVKADVNKSIVKEN